MNGVEAYQNVMVGGAEYARDFVEPAIEQVQGAFRGPDRVQVHREVDLHSEERCCWERARIARELHDTLLQGVIGASLLLHAAVEQTPADSPSKLFPLPTPSVWCIKPLTKAASYCKGFTRPRPALPR